MDKALSAVAPVTYDPYSPVDPATRANPYPVYHELRSRSPIHWSPLLGLWLVTRHRDVLALARDPRFSAGNDRISGLFAQLNAFEQARLRPLREAFSAWVLFQDPPRHTVGRGLINQAFTPAASERLRPAIASLTEQLLDAAVARGNMDVIRDLAYPLPVAVIGEMLGVPAEDRYLLKSWSDAIASFMGNLKRTISLGEAAQRGMAEMAMYVRGLIRERRRRPTDDLLSQLLAAEENGRRLDEEAIVGTASLLLVAGHETTTNLIGNGLNALLDHPRELERLRRDPSLVSSAVEEFLRYDSPVQFVSRVAKAPTEVDGRRFEEGQRVLLILGAANRDPVVFGTPDVLDVGRRDNRHLSFGQGIHFCPGAALARVEAQIAVGAVLARFPGLRRAEGPSEWRLNLGFRGLTSLPVTWG